MNFCFKLISIFALLLGGSGWAQADLEPSDWLSPGRELLADGHYRLAVTSLTERVQSGLEDPIRSEAALLLVRGYYEMGQTNEVIKTLNQYEVLLRDTGRGLDRSWWMARTLFEGQAYGPALDILENIPAPDRTSARGSDLIRLQARCLIRLDRSQEAIALLEAIPPSSAGLSPESQLDLAAVWLVTGKPEQGEALLRDLASRSQGGQAIIQARLWLSERLVEQGAEDEALLWLERITSMTNSIPAGIQEQAYYQTAVAHEAMGSFSNAVQALVLREGVLQDKTKLLHNRIFRARLLIRAREFTAGAALLRKQLTAAEPDEIAAEAVLFLAQAMMDAELFAEAEKTYQEFLEVFTEPKGRDQALLGKGWALYKQGRFAEAAAAYQRTDSEAQGEEIRRQARFKIADAYFQNSQFKIAREEYLEYSRRYPGDNSLPQAMFQAALCLHRMDEADKAISELERIRALFTDHAIAERALLQVAYILEERERWDEAVESFTLYINTYLKGIHRPRALLERGLIFYRSGLFNQSLVDFERIVRDHAGSEAAERAFYMRGWCLYLQGRDEDALAICNKFLERFPKSTYAGEVMFWLAEYYYNAGKFPEATKQFEAAANSSADASFSERALLWAGRSAAQNKEYTVAITYYDKIVKQFPDSTRVPEALYYQGDALTNLGDFPSAILVYDRIIKEYSGSYLALLAWGRKGDCFWTLGEADAQRLPEALNCWRFLLDDPQASPEMKLQAEYKLANTLRRMNEREKALDAYLKLVYSYPERRNTLGPSADFWFTSAALDAAEMLGKNDEWPRAIQVYQRIIDAGVPAAREADERIKKIRREQFIFF